MNKILAICGPTATGKTKLAVNLAKQSNGELISADSRQIYKGMDIGTGKDLDENSKLKTQNSKLQIKIQKYTVGYKLKDEVPIWLIDVVNPSDNFSVAEYQDLAWKVIKDIWQRNKLPILVGGTGFYIKAVVDGIETTGIPQDWELRKKFEALSLDELQREIQKVDSQKWNSMNNSDRNNPRRLIRALEIAHYKEKNLRSIDLYQYSRKKMDVLMIGLTTLNKLLYKRIDERVEKRVKQGVIKEIKELLNKGYSWNLPSMSGLGYRVWKDYFDKKATKEETIQKWKYQEHSYARRQLTWFKKDKRIDWINIKSINYPNKIREKIKSWLSKSK